MTISKISLFNCFARPEKDKSAPPCRVSRFLKENPISKACFNFADGAWRTLSGRIQKFDPSQYPILRTCLSKKSPDSLSLACAEGQIETVRRLIKTGANVDLIEERAGGWTPLLLACAEGHLEIVRLLLEADANVNLATKNDGWTPLHIACSRGRTGIAKLLIEKKANIFAKNSSGFTPLNFSKNLDLLRALTGTEKIKAFDLCKDFHDFHALLFPPDIEAPPSNWESLLARIPKNPKLLELEKEKIRLKKDSIQWPLVEPFNEAENRSTLSAKNILNALLKIHPLFAKAWELAEQPDLEEIPPEASEDPREHSRGNLAYYSLDSHKITIENGRTEVQKLSAMVFETINAIQRASFESVKKWDDLTREEYAFLSESVEYNSDYWRTIILRDPEAPSIDYKGLWKTHNISYAEGLISHAEAVRRRWDRVYFPRWLETHPEEFKKRLAELEQAHSLSSALTADGLKAK